MTTFKALEQSGWTEKASAYDEHFATIADQAIEPILDTVGDVAGRDVLDICCGTGNLAGAVAARGGRVTGIDFAPTMIEIARSKVAGADFQVGDAEALQFPNQSFDVALCSFGLWHMSEPDMALAEAARVLKKDGVYAYTTWLPPQQGWDMFDLLVKAVHKHGTMDVDLPQAPPPFRFADETEAQRTLVAHGFRNISLQKKDGALDWDYRRAAPRIDLQSNCQGANDHRGTKAGSARSDQAKHPVSGRDDAS